MLVLKLKKGERVIVNGGEMIVTVVWSDRGAVRLGFEAPPSIVIHREEVQKRIDAGIPPHVKGDSPAVTEPTWFTRGKPSQERKST